jgi:nucleoside-diphosphate-sugar epimerase
MSESIVIVGGTGHLGKEVALLYPSAKIFGRDIDLGSRRECEDKLGKFDICIFLAADPRLHYYKNRPYECVNANYALIRHIPEIGFKRIVFASSVGVYRCSTNIADINDIGWNQYSSFYGMAKIMAEKHLQAFHSKCTLSILRFSTFWSRNIEKGPLYDLAVNGNSYVNLRSRFSFVHAEDAASAISTCLDQGYSGIYNITSARSTVLSQIEGIPDNIHMIGDAFYDYGSDSSNWPKGWKPRRDISKMSYNEIRAEYLKEC